MNKLITLCAIICLVCLGHLAYYIYKPEPNYTIAKVATSTRITQLDRRPENYSCVKLKRLDNQFLTYCERIVPSLAKDNEFAVRGMYDRQVDTIWLDINSPTDRKLHELTHAVDVYKGDQLRDTENKAYEMQSFYLQLKALGKI